MPPLSYKSDESFLSKLVIGSVSARRVFKQLQSVGHNPIELERGSMHYKVWKEIKVKRIRVPDLLCLKCAQRVESRGKTSLKVSMSHSLTDPERAWDSGLEPSDMVAFVAVESTGERPIDYQAHQLVQYVSIQQMRHAFHSSKVIQTQAKGVEEGSERQLLWPTSTASSEGVITTITADRIQYKRASDQRIITKKLNLSKGGKKIKLTPLVKVGDQVQRDQFIASVVRVRQQIPCATSVPSDHYISLLSSSSLSKRYTAAKALSHLLPVNVQNVFEAKLSDPDEHIYVQLEAAAGLIRKMNTHGLQFAQERLQDPYPQYRLETVIMLGEINQPSTRDLLKQALLDTSQHPEVRAGAAWALGELQDRSSLGVLVRSFTDVEPVIRAEAARSLAKVARKYGLDVAAHFPTANPAQRPGIAWALSKAEFRDVAQILESLIDLDTRQWAAYIIGTQDEANFIGDIEALKQQDPEVYFAATVLWKILSHWVYKLEEY